MNIINKSPKKDWEERFYKQLGNYLRKKRLEFNIDNNKNLSCKEHQKKLLGIGDHSVNDYESGRTKISLFDFLVLLGFYKSTPISANYTDMLKIGIGETIKESGISPSLIYKFIKNQSE